MKRVVVSAWTLSLAVGAAACLYSVPDLATDGAGLGGPGGTGGQGGGTSGGVASGGPAGSEGGVPLDGADANGSPGCVDLLDVPPQVLSPADPNAHFNGAPVIARLGDVFGVAWIVEGEVDGSQQQALQFATITRAGVIKTERIVGPGGRLPTIAASGASFAIGSSGVSAVYRYDANGSPVGAAVALPNPATFQVLLTGSPGGVLVTTMTQPEGLSVLWLADGSGTPTASQAVPIAAGEGAPFCCAERTWDATFGFDPPEFAVSWIRELNTAFNFEHVSTAGVAAPSANVVGGPSVYGDPQLVPFQDRVLVTDCHTVIRVGADGKTDATVTLPSDPASCQLGVAGTRVRVLRGAVGGTLQWRALDLATGAGPTMFTLGASVYWTRVAWDGADGFGIVWSDDTAVRYAHIRTMCP